MPMTDNRLVVTLLGAILVIVIVATFWFVAWTVSGPTYHKVTVNGVECIGSVSGPAGLSCNWDK